MTKKLDNDVFSARRLLWLAVAIGIGIAVMQLIFSVDLYRDSAGVYSYMARALANGEYREAFHPHIPSLNVLLSRVFTLAGLRPEQAMAAVSSLFYIATIPFLYRLLKNFVPERLAAVGALLFACAPKMIRFSCTAIIDSGKVFFLVAGLYFAYRMIEGKFRSYASALWFGVALGGLSLARSEGAGNGCILFGCVALFWLAQSFREKRVMPICPWLLTVGVWILAILSRVWINWRFCGKFVFDGRINKLAAELWTKLTHAASAASAGASTATATAPIDPHRVSSWLELLRKNAIGSYEVYLVLAALGIVLLIAASKGRKWSLLWPEREVPDFLKWHPFYAVLLVGILGNALLFKLSGVLAYRYFLINIPLLMVFTVMGAYWLGRWAAKLLPRPLQIAAVAAVALILAGQVVNGAENIFYRVSRIQYRMGHLAGEIMRRENPDARVLFHRACIEWYWSGMKRALPFEKGAPDFRAATDFDYVLMHKAEEEGMKIIESRRDLQEIPLPPESTVRLFGKVVRNR